MEEVGSSSRPLISVDRTRTSNPGFLTSDKSFEVERNMNTLNKRKSHYTKSRLPTFGSLTTGKPMH